MAAEEQIELDDATAVLELVSRLRILGCQIPNVEGPITAKCARLGCISFLRCAHVFVGSLGYSPVSSCELGNFENMRISLALPSISQLLRRISRSFIDEHFSNWVSEFRGSNQQIAVDVGGLNMMGLPAAFSTLALQSCSYLCPRTQSAPLVPALCLLCGAVLCARSTCCQVTRSIPGLGEQNIGACTMHAKRFVHLLIHHSFHDSS